MPLFNKKANNYTAYLALIAATALWGAAGPVIKLTVGYVPVFTFLFLRFLIICIVMLPTTIFQFHRVRIEKQDFINLVILGILSQSVLFIPFYGYKYTTAIEASLIATAYPIIAVASAEYFYKEKVMKLEKVGISLATLGTLVVILAPALKGGSDLFSKQTSAGIFGNFLIFAYQITWLLYIIWSKKIMGKNSAKVTELTKKLNIKPMKLKKFPPMLLTLFTFYVGLATFTPLAIFENMGAFGEVNFNIYTLGITPWLGIFYMAIFSSIVAYSLFQWGLSKTEMTDTAVFSYLNPLFAVPIAYLLLTELPSKSMILGALLIGIGVVIAEKYKN